MASKHQTYYFIHSYTQLESESLSTLFPTKTLIQSYSITTKTYCTLSISTIPNYRSI